MKHHSPSYTSVSKLSGAYVRARSPEKFITFLIDLELGPEIVVIEDSEGADIIGASVLEVLGGLMIVGRLLLVDGLDVLEARGVDRSVAFSVNVIDIGTTIDEVIVDVLLNGHAVRCLLGFLA
jgi:hypothetical protein